MDNLTNVCEATSQSQEFDNFRPTHRKGKKLLAEKKRRARINNCLMQIRRLVCEEQDEEDTDIDKMEKAEILEKTLEVLTRLRHENPKISYPASTHKAMASRYASGFSLCAEESIRYIQSSRLVPSEVKVQLQNHLRAIARRVESTVNVGTQDLKLAQGFCALTSTLPSSPSLDKLTAGEILSSSVDNSVVPVSAHFSGDVSEGSNRYITSPTCYSTEGCDRYITSPLCYSTPIHYQHAAFMKSNIHLQKMDGKLLNYSSDAYTYNVDQRKKSARGRAAQAPGQSTQIKQGKQTLPLSNDSQCDQSEGYFSDSSRLKHCCSQSSLSSSFFFPNLTSDTSLTNSSSLVTSSSVLPTTPTLPYRTVYPYPRLEPHFITPDIFGESTQVDSRNVFTPAVQELNMPSKVLDLCVKQTDEQQVSPDAMWRPW